MAKSTALKDRVLIDNVDLSTFAHGVTPASEHERVDVSGFNATGADEFLAGRTEQSVDVDFWIGYAAGESFQVLWNLHTNRTVFDFKWRPDQTLAVSATNPELRGSVQILTFSPAAARGEARDMTATFTAASSAGLQYFYT